MANNLFIPFLIISNDSINKHLIFEVDDFIKFIKQIIINQHNFEE